MKILFYALCAALVVVGGYFGYKKWFAKDEPTAEEKDTKPKDKSEAELRTKEKLDHIAESLAQNIKERRTPTDFVAAPKPQTVFDFMPKPEPASPLIRTANPLANVLAQVAPLVPPVRPLVYSPAILAALAKAEAMRKGKMSSTFNMGIPFVNMGIPFVNMGTSVNMGTLPPIVPLAPPKAINDRGIPIITPIVAIGNKFSKMSSGVNDRPGANAQIGGKNVAVNNGKPRL